MKLKLHDVFQKDYMEKLNSLHIVINNRMRTGLSGIRKSSVKGASHDFLGFKNYSLGDDIKHIDWNSYARLDRLFIKEFNEEKDTSFNIFIDTSKSMENMPDGLTKAFFSKLLAASLAYIGIKNSDTVNLFTYNENLSIKKLNIKNNFKSVLDFLESIEYKNETLMNSSFKELSESGSLKNRGLSIIISDFFSFDGFEEAVKTLRYKKAQELLLVHVLSEAEINPDFLGNVRLIDSENGNALNITCTEDLISRYAASLRSFQNKISLFCKEQGGGYIFAAAETDDVIKILKKFLYYSGSQH